MIGENVTKGKLAFPKAKTPVVLQPRDEMIMSLVREFRFLGREQLQRLLDFPCTTRINIRLKKLYDHGYLSRLLLPTVAGKPKAMYFLGPSGVLILAESLGLDPVLMEKERKRLWERKALFLNHQFFLNDVRIALSLVIKNNPTIALEQWIKEKDCLIEFLGNQGKVTALRPDACFCLAHSGKLYSFFVEVDCSTMTNSRLRAKAKAYLDYARSGRSQLDFGFQYFRVLIITKTHARLANLKTSIEELTDRLFFFSTRDSVCQDPILGRIWQRAGWRGIFSLLEV